MECQLLVLKKVSYLLNLARIQLHQAKHKFFSFRTSAITSMLSKQFKGAGRHPAPGGGASSSSRGGESSSSRGGASSISRGRGVIQLQGPGRHPAPGGGASSSSRGRGVTQLVTYNRVGGVEEEVTSGYLTT